MIYKLIALFFVEACALKLALAQTTFPLERPTHNIGDTWTYQRTDLWTKQVQSGALKVTVREIANDKIFYDIVNRDGRKIENIRNIDTNSISVVRGEEQVDQVFKWPLIEGAKHTYKTLNARNQWEWTYEPTCVVEGFEVLKVVAGEFNAVKIVCKGMWANTPGFGTGSGMNEAIVWYSPAIKRGVKYQNKNWNGSRLDTQTSDELVEFKLK
jgi:hypothetical protein